MVRDAQARLATRWSAMRSPDSRQHETTHNNVLMRPPGPAPTLAAAAAAPTRARGRASASRAALRLPASGRGVVLFAAAADRRDGAAAEAPSVRVQDGDW
eukprot:1140544-Prymnesium_polylepis.1